MSRPLAVRCAAEAAGTALLVGIGTGALVAGARLGGAPTWLLAVVWFLAVTLPVWLFVRLSGAHLNPSVTVALAVDGTFPRREVVGYVSGQLVGAFAGSVVVLVALGRAARLGSTVPLGAELPLAFAAEAGFAFLLTLSVLLQSRRGLGWRSWRLVLPRGVVGLATYVIGPITGCSLNIARTLAPAVLSGTFQNVWVYLVAVPLGAMAAVPAARVLFR